MADESGPSFALPSHDDLDSEFEFDAEVGDIRKSRNDLAFKPPPAKVFKPQRQSFHDECAKESGRFQQQAYLSMDAYTRHKKLINDYVLCYPGATEKLKRDTSHYKTDHDVIRENHRFLWEEEDDAKSWGEQLAKKYYDRLFKEYCLCDLTRYKNKQVGMRWRTEKEVILGKGQFLCGSVHCDRQDDLESWEVLFSYQEKGEKRSALVKLRLCEKCTRKLHHGYKGKMRRKLRWKKTQNEEIESDASSKVVEASSSQEEQTSEKEVSESEIWKQPVKEEAEQTKEDAFEEFLEELFL